MTETVHRDRAPERRTDALRVVRSRGSLSGALLVLLGIWGALIPFVGPYFDYAYSPGVAWTWTTGRLWLEVIPGVATILGGLLLAMTANRAVGVFAGWLASAAGAWFVVGPILSRLWNGPAGSAGSPLGGTTSQVVEQIGFFYGLGAVILFLAAQALGRFTVRSVRDVRAAEEDRAARRRAAVATPAPGAAAPVAAAPAAAGSVTETKVIETPPAAPAAEPVPAAKPAEPAPPAAEFSGNRAVQPEETGGRHEAESAADEGGATRLTPGARPPR